MAKKEGNGKVIEVVAEETTIEHNRMLETLRKILLATVGGAALAWDEIEDFVGRMVERGEVAEKDARKLLKEVSDKRKQAGAAVDKRMEETLAHMDVPSKADINALSAKIAALTQKVDELKKAQGA
jgi:polyhydroxyalkanoate synthesis regulator phasin